MKRFSKPVSEIIVHCTATPAGRDLSLDDITRYHRLRGFETVGYHYLVLLDGTVCPGRDSLMVGAHCLGHNDRSIGVAYVGGLDRDGNPADTRTPAQREALLALLRDLRRRYRGALIYGHRDFAAKACPCFDARAEYSAL